MAVNRADQASAHRIELRRQSVADIDEVQAFDLIWLSQSFLADEVLARALPALRRAARPRAALLMLVATNSEPAWWALLSSSATFSPAAAP